MRILALVLLLCGLSPMAANAFVMDVDVGTVDLQLPPDFCPLSRDNAQDKPRYEQQDRVQSANNTVLLIALPCADLAASRAGNPWPRWAIWLELGPPGRAIQLPAGKSRSVALDEISAAVPSLDLKTIETEVGQAYKQDNIGIKLNKMGVIGRDDVGLYAGLVGDASSPTLKRTIGCVFAWSVMRSRFFTFNLYQDFEGTKTFDALLPIVKSVIAKSTAATEGKL